MQEPTFDFSGRFAGLSVAQINDQIGSEQRALLRRFFGRGQRGIVAAGERFAMPPRLTLGALQSYHEIARRAIEAGKDQWRVQRLRLQLVERALKEIVTAEPDFNEG